ncbi:MAG: site-2 protease family protein [Ruminococcaceae bacterium]|nr:site-2 protease family protein [Oscillospiraceae bacterium]
MLFDLFSEDFDMLDLIIKLFSRLFVVFCTMPIHEYAHALIATKLGDQTPRLAGRLTLNPMAHISPMGAIMIFLFGFGYAKPVSVNPRNFKDSKKGMALTAIAGPISNLIMGFIFIVLAVVYANLSHAETILYNAIFSFLLFAGTINVNLAVFNLLPIPPLDGSRILQLLIPAKYYYKFLEYERYIVILVFILIATGVLSGPLSAISYFIIDLFVDIASLPF